MIAVDGKAHAVAGGQMWPWHFSGYGPPVAHGTVAGAVATLITPPTTLAVLKAAYRPVWHPTIGAKAR